MNIIRKSIVIGFTVLGMASAYAQDAAQTAAPAGRHTDAAQVEQRQARMAEMYAKHQARLHDQLKLTAQQESAWANYQAAIKPAARSGDRPQRGAFVKLSGATTHTLRILGARGVVAAGRAVPADALAHAARVSG